MSRRLATSGSRVPHIVVGHANPDFDAYGAMVAATKLSPGSKAVFLGSQNPNVREFHNLHAEFLEFVELRDVDLSSVERVTMVDTRDPSRLGEMEEVVRRSGVQVVVYDHHPAAVGDIEGAEEHCMPVGATTSILVHEIRDRGIPITPLEASVLLLGIHEDTGSLTYVSATAYDADAVAFLMAAGADLEVVNQFLTRTLTPEQKALLTRLIDTLEVWDANGQPIAVGWAESVEYVDSASVITHHLCDDMGYRVAMAVIAMPDRVHVVARSRVSEVDVGRVLERLGGGGHPLAASAAIKGATVSEVLRRLKDAALDVVRPPATARDIMTSPVRTVTPDTTMDEAGRIMERWGHGALPVTDGGRLVGMVTRKDVDKARRHKLAHAPVRGFMSREPLFVGPETSLETLQSLLSQTGVGRVPVTDDGSIVGIVTRKDLLRAFHGERYTDKKATIARSQASARFMTSFQDVLPERIRDVVVEIGRMAHERGVRAHVVGGFVRDMLLARPNLDVDIVVEGDGLAFAEHVAEATGWRIRVHKRFGTAVLIIDRGLHVDVTSARAEYYTRPGALPTVERSSLRQDLFRRDFSINAMAASITPDSFGQIADPFGGLADLERGVVRALHSLSFVEDPTRVLRAARFAVKFGFRIDASTEALLKQAVEMDMLAEVSGARLREELLDIVDEERAAQVFGRLAELGALGGLVPDGVPPADVQPVVAAAAEAYEDLAARFSDPVRRRVVLVAALVSRASKAAAERWLRRMRFGKEYAAPALAIVERGQGTLRALRDRRPMRDSRIYSLVGALPPEAVVCLWAAAVDPVPRERIGRYVDVLSRVRPAVTGDDLVAMGFKPGRAFSAILAQALADRLDGKAVGREAELKNLEHIAKRWKRMHPEEADGSDVARRPVRARRAGDRLP
ncbi:CBS domain-containing protein [Coriobacteriia bacterium Es71-Z0120]|uniref:CBS domain-containing protein n=1 Tax=Parvivirga hydrogeniphila TaxID=2939460 RepID=UPI002260D060|nr:CBS domain-containing protein [Parvivirga hydrogeniphila]MCL4079041.1 CBS domain-containing protein [Parvivirga hydrogeniphila]